MLTKEDIQQIQMLIQEGIREGFRDFYDNFFEPHVTKSEKQHEEILKRLDKNDRDHEKIFIELARNQKDHVRMFAKLEEIDEKLDSHEERLKKLERTVSN